MKNKAKVLKTLFNITWLLLLFVIFWFFVKPRIPLLVSGNFPELSTGAYFKWGLIESMLVIGPAAISYVIGLRVTKFATTSHSEKKKTQYFVLSIIVIGALLLVAFLSEIISDFTTERMFSDIDFELPDVNIWAYFVLEVVVLAFSTLGKLYRFALGISK